MPVELHPAYWFTCDSCACETFVKSAALEVTEDQRRELYEEWGFDEGDEGVFHRPPSRVECEACGASFPAVVHLSGYYDDEEE